MSVDRILNGFRVLCIGTAAITAGTSTALADTREDIRAAYLEMTEGL